MYLQPIPVFARFQWLNHPHVVHILSPFLKPPTKGRKGYDKVLMFRWLMYRQLMNCSYRDLESMSGIDYSTFIKFRRRLIEQNVLVRMFKILSGTVALSLPSITAVLDSSFVETYSKHDEEGSEYFGYKEKNGFKWHKMIDHTTRVPLRQCVTPGARADVVWGRHLIRGTPKDWNISGLLADKAYDSWDLVAMAHQKWEGIRVGIPVRRTPGEKKEPDHPGVIKNRKGKESDRYLHQRFLNKRGEIERSFSRSKRVFNLGEERTRHLKNFRANCDTVAIMEILEWSTKPSLWIILFTRLVMVQ